MYLPGLSEPIKKSSKFRFFATQNPLSYSRRNVLPHSIASRLFEVKFQELPPGQLQEVVFKAITTHKKGGPDSADLRDVSQRMVKAYLGVNGVIKNPMNKITVVPPLTLRFLVMWAKRIAASASSGDIISTKGAYNIGCELLLPRFPTTDMATIVHDVIAPIFETEKTPTPKFDVKYLIEVCMRCNEPVMLLGPTSRKTTLLGEITNQKPFFCSPETTIADLVGQLTILNNAAQRDEYRQKCETTKQAGEWYGGSIPAQLVDHRLSQLDIYEKTNKTKPCVVFKDGIVVQRILERKPIVLKNIHLADKAVVERFNNLLDVNRSFSLSEDPYITQSNRSNSADLPLSNEFSVLAVAHLDSSQSSLHLSPAMRSRFVEIWIDGFSFDELLQQFKKALNVDIHRVEICNYTNHFLQWFQRNLRLRVVEHGVYVRRLFKLASFLNSVLATAASCDEVEIFLQFGFKLFFLDGIPDSTKWHLQYLQHRDKIELAATFYNRATSWKKPTISHLSDGAQKVTLEIAGLSIISNTKINSGAFQHVSMINNAVWIIARLFAGMLAQL